MSNEVTKYGYDHYVFPLCLIYSVLMILGGYFPILYIIVFVLTLYILLNPNIDKGLSVLFFILPFSQIFKLNPASTSLHTYLVLVFALINIVRLKRFDGKIGILFILLSLYLLIGIGNEYTTYIKLLTGGIMLYECVELVDKNKCQNVMLSYAVGFIVSSFLGLNKHLNQRYIPYFSEFNQDNIGGHVVYRFSGLNEDPNYYSINAFFVIVYFLILFFNGKQSKPVSIAVLITSIVFGCMTYSKMFILSLAILLLFTLKELLKSQRQFILTIFSFLTITLVGYLVSIYSGFFNGIMSRFDVEDISNNRVKIWTNYLNYMFSSLKTLFFGEGIGAVYYSGVGPHNTYIELVYYFGIIGGLIFLCYIIVTVNHNSVEIKRKPMNYIGAGIYLFMIFTLGVLKSAEFFFDCIMIWIMFNLDCSLKKIGQEKDNKSGVEE